MYALSMNKEYIAKIKYEKTKEKQSKEALRQGVIYFKNGDRYTGGIKQGLGLGKGKIVLNDMSFFQGIWSSTFYKF